MGRSAARKNNTKNRSALENDANEDRNACSTEFFSSLLDSIFARNRSAMLGFVIK
jgi:hypothetical protein